MSMKSTFVKLITIVDSDNTPVELEIRKLENGAYVGLDASYIEADIGPIFSPYENGNEMTIPEHEHGEWVI